MVRHRHRLALLPVLTAATLCAAGCGGAQSALAPAGRDALTIATITWWMTIAGAIIWSAVMLLAYYAAHTPGDASTTAANRLIVGGGVVFPLAVLSVTVVVGLAALPGVLQPAADDRLTLEVTGSQWWWRVRYLRPGLPAVEVANEIHLPTARRVDTRLASSDVVHSFWIPALAGKMDMIPGRVNELALEPLQAGVYRGACAEFCGLSHARMNLTVIVSDPGAFETWLDRQAQPAAAPTSPAAEAGRRIFLDRGCSTCHTIRGTAAVGVVGPDLTHVGSRRAIAAGAVPATAAGFRRWIATTDAIKPGVHMPAFASLPDAALDAVASYLAELR